MLSGVDCLYKLEYLPVAMRDMTDIAHYISCKLSNPTAANALAEEMVSAADKLTRFPYVNAIHQTIRPLDQEYRKLIVKNYLMFYWVDEAEKTVTVARVMYGGRDYEKML